MLQHEHQYCAECGARMKRREIERGFDRRTGRPVKVAVWACPLWTEGARGHDGGSYEPVEHNPDMALVRDYSE